MCILLYVYAYIHIYIYVYIWPCATSDMHEGRPEGAQVQNRSADKSYVHIHSGLWTSSPWTAAASFGPFTWSKLSSHPTAQVSPVSKASVRPLKLPADVNLQAQCNIYICKMHAYIHMYTYNTFSFLLVHRWVHQD